ILAKAEGNPFFLEELARAAREHGAASTALTAPDTVQEVLLARIDWRPPADSDLLQAAAVIGKDFSFEILRAVVGGPDDVIQEGLRHLQGAEFIHETGAMSQAEYTFKHALTHDVAYERLSGEQRRELHAKTLGAIEALPPVRPADQWRLGWVFSYLTQMLRLTGGADRAIDTGEQAVAIAEARNDFTLQVATEFHLGSAYEDLGDYRRASVILRRVVERLQGERVYERFGLSGLPSVVARARSMCCLAELGEFAEARDRGTEGTRIAEEVYDPHGLVNAEFGAATIRILKGEFPEALPGLERGLGLCQSSNLLLMYPRVAAALGFVYAQSGRLPEAVPLL